MTSSVGDGPDNQDMQVGERGKGKGSTAGPECELGRPNVGERREERGWAAAALGRGRGGGRERAHEAFLFSFSFSISQICYAFV
jgi:hypothetical protein